MVNHGTFSDLDNGWDCTTRTHLENHLFRGEGVRKPDWSSSEQPWLRLTNNSVPARELGANKVVDDVIHFLAKKGNCNERIHLVGHSHGGNVAFLAVDKLAALGVAWIR